jgi:hypothetical protein
VNAGWLEPMEVLANLGGSDIVVAVQRISIEFQAVARFQASVGRLDWKWTLHQISRNHKLFCKKNETSYL